MHRGLYLRFALVAVGIFVSAPVAACTIPVFRYALERWEADRLLVVVYHDGQLTDSDDAAVRDLARRSSQSGGPLNIEVVRYDVSAPPEALRDLQPPADRQLPWVEVRSRAAGPRMVVRWQGSLAEATSDALVFESPARAEVIRRILDGDAAVWVVVGPEADAAALGERLKTHIDSVRRELDLPAGIGLPGSEIYASIPLEIRFSVLTISHTDANEQHFFQQIAASAKEWSTDQTYVVPVFGRLRALEIMSKDEVDEFLVRDVCEFLCAACSCRVKEANPGFDLLASVNWHERLFGDALSPPSEAAGLPNSGVSESGGEETATYVAIPAGNERAAKPEAGALDEAAAPPAEIATLEASPAANAPAPRTDARLPLGLISLAAVGVVMGVVAVTLISRLARRHVTTP